MLTEFVDLHVYKYCMYFMISQVLKNYLRHSLNVHAALASQ
jgi:hypothetical protein